MKTNKVKTMATRTVINTNNSSSSSNNNMPQMRGISIIIDQDPSRQRQQQHQQQQQTFDDHPGKITIYQKTTTTTAAPMEVSTLQRMSPASTTTTTKTATTTTTPSKTTSTLIDINRNNGDRYEDARDHDVVQYENNDDDADSRNHHRRNANETGYTTAPTAAQQQLLLRVAEADADAAGIGIGAKANDASERGKLSVDVGKALEQVTNSSSTTTTTTTTTTTISSTTIGVDERGDRVAKSMADTSCESRNGTSADHDVAVSGHQTTIIECNNRDDYAIDADVRNGDNDGAHDDDRDAHDRDRCESDKESRKHCSAGRGTGVSVADGDGVRGGSTSQVELELKLALENGLATTLDDSRTTKADCASALTATAIQATEATNKATEATGAAEAATRNSRRCAPNENAATTTHVVKIRIQNGDNASNESHRIAPKSTPEKQVTVVQLNETQRNAPSLQDQRPRSSEFVVEEEDHDDRMVQSRAASTAPIGHSASVSNGGGGGGGVSSGGTTVTELNVSNQSYLYYMMSSGQFSPCDTLDSGTGSDLESNGHPSGMHPGAGSAGGGSSASVGSGGVGGGAPPKLELHLKTTKLRIANGVKGTAASSASSSSNKALHGEGCARAGSLTDSEESESSSLSCDSLHSTEFMRQSSVSPTGNVLGNGHGHSHSDGQRGHSNVNGKDSQSPVANGLGAFLPDSLLRDIRDRKFPTNDFEAKYGGQRSPRDSVHEQDFAEVEAEAAERQDSFAFIRQRNKLNLNLSLNGLSNGAASDKTTDKRASAPSKTFVLNASDGTFVDTKMNSMPRTYEADKYYNFHVNEHENFRSFGQVAGSGRGQGHGLGEDGSPSNDTASLSEYDDMQHMNEDVFAGYKDIRCGSAASTIRSSKGTVRGVKNRVRNGIATFLQLQQPNVKNFKEKDLGKVVLYTTSMGIIRDTYAKCSNMKQILRTLLVKFEERDVFMSVEYQAEIKERMHTEAIQVPQLFVEGQHIGDAETVERLNESGELRQLLKPYKSIATTYTCQTCGGYRLLPCPSCSGSKKSVHRNHFTAEFVALKCMNCDEVGLVKCHNC